MTQKRTPYIWSFPCSISILLGVIRKTEKKEKESKKKTETEKKEREGEKKKDAQIISDNLIQAEN